MYRFVPRDALAYDRLRSPPQEGAPFLLDEAYRLAHLPLVNPAHPDVTSAAPGKDYLNGVHGRVRSLVLPIAWKALAASPAFVALEGQLRSASFASKIAWTIAERRRGRLHATLCGSLAPEDVTDGRIAALAASGRFRVRLEGLFSGNVNRGRLYLETHPEERDGRNVVHRIQEAMGCAPSDLYVVGIHNLIDHLTVEEAADLRAMMARWRGRLVAELTVEELWLLSSVDDLVLESTIERVIRLA